MGTMGTVRVRSVSTGCFLVSERSGTVSTLSTKSSTNRSWLALELICTLLATTEVTTLRLELVQANSWKLSGSVVLGLVLVNLVDWDGGVNNGWLDSLLLDNWLDVLVYVVVNVLSSNGSTLNGLTLSLLDLTSGLELSGLSSKTLLYVVVISVCDFAVLNTGHLVGVLLWENLTILDRLNGGVVMILVDLTINGGLLLLELSFNNALMGDGWVDALVDSGVMLSILVEESGNGLLGFIHFD